MANTPIKNDAFRSINVLVVEDEELAQRFLVRILEQLGVGEVLIADNGADALAKLTESDLPIDIVICDIEMPEIDGYEFVRKVRFGTVPQYADVPILILTGKDTDQNIQKARFHKINGFIIKPPGIEDLERRIRKVLGL